MLRRAGLSTFLFLSLASLFLVHRHLQSPDGAPLYIALNRLVYGRHEWHPLTAFEAAGAQLLRESQEGYEGYDHGGHGGTDAAEGTEGAEGAERHHGHQGGADHASPGSYPSSSDVATLPDGSLVPLVRDRALFDLDDAADGELDGEGGGGGGGGGGYYSQHERALAANSAASRKVGGKGSFSGALATKRKPQYMLDTKGRIFDRYPSCGVCSIYCGTVYGVRLRTTSLLAYGLPDLPAPISDSPASTPCYTHVYSGAISGTLPPTDQRPSTLLQPDVLEDEDLHGAQRNDDRGPLLPHAALHPGLVREHRSGTYPNKLQVGTKLLLV